MIDVDLLRRESLTTLVKDFKTDPKLLLMNANIFGTPEQVEGDTTKWDVETVERDLGDFEGPDSPATPRKLTKIGEKTATLLRAFKSKRIPGNQLINLRNPGSVARSRVAQDFVGREELSLRRYVDRIREWAYAKALQGVITGNSDSVPFTITMGIPTENIFGRALGSPQDIPQDWDDPGADIITDLEKIIDSIEVNHGYTPKTAYTSRRVIKSMVNNDVIQFVLSGSSKGREMLEKGSIGHFWGIDWVPYTQTSKAGAVVTRHLDDRRVVFVPEADGEWSSAYEGSEVIPADDGDSMIEVFGLNSYSETKKNPTGAVIYIVYKFLPVLKVPGAITYADVSS